MLSHSADLRFPLERLMHPYCRRDKSGWPIIDIAKYSRKQNFTEGEIDSPVLNENEDAVDASNRERNSHMYWANGHTVWSLIHRRAAMKGALAMEKVDKMMTKLMKEVTGSTETDDLNIASILKNVANELERQFGASSTVRDVSNENLRDGVLIGNANQGRVKGRSTRRRARSSLETSTPNGKGSIQ